ncbi:hypothetical protein MRS44_005728 [Fusarium solani]|uniref:uncharacterized protein n=1 Tax=Fusarium solani TaxID=169388 RepID=UPI0032C49ADC|nr:hypothetical protein MRS44_005728 [Fusarium solani]
MTPTTEHRTLILSHLKSYYSRPHNTNMSGSLPVVKDQVALPGLRDARGRITHGGEETLEVIKLLKVAGIPACVVDEWDICVPAHQVEDTEQIFRGNDLYEPVKLLPPVVKSLRHLNPTFQLKGVGYFFFLTPSSRCFINLEMENCDISKKGILYPKMPQFARSLLVLQNGSNIADFIDGMDLDEEWAEENIDFDDLQVKGVEFSKMQNAELQAARLGELNVRINYRELWNAIVSEKEGRIESMKKGSTGDQASCGGKDQGRETRDDHTDLVYVCMSEDYRAQVRASPRNFSQEWKDCFLDKVIKQDPALEESIRWALDIPRTPSPEADQAFRTGVGGSRQGGGHDEYGSYQGQSGGYDYYSAGSTSQSCMAGGGYYSHDGAAGNFYASSSGQSDVPQDGYWRYSASHGDWYHEHSNGQYSWASEG